MILTSLRTSDHWDFELGFHPRLTVISGLGEERRALVAKMIASAFQGVLLGMEIEVEVDGELIMLTSEVIEDLELGSYVPDVRIRQRDLPGAAVQDAPEVQPDPEPEPEEVHEDPIANPAITARFGLAPILLRHLEGGLADAWKRLENALEVREQAEVALTELRDAPKDPGRAEVLAAEAELARAREVFSAAQNRFDQALGPAEQLGELSKQRLSLRQQVEEVGEAMPEEPPPTDEVVETLSALDLAMEEAQNPKPLPAAQELADRWVDVLARIDERPKPSPPEWLVKQTETALESARSRLKQAEREYQSAAVSPDDVAAVERAHSELVDARTKSGRLFGGRKKVQQLEAAENEALAKIGVNSYDTFLLDRVAFGAGRERAEKLVEETRLALADAEAVWDELHTPQNDPEMTALIEERNGIRAEIAELLGVDPPAAEIEETLRSTHEPPPDLGPVIEEVWTALERQGVRRSENDEDVRTAARAWLAAIVEEEERRQSLQMDLDNLQRQLEEVEAQVAEVQSLLDEFQDPADVETRMAQLQAEVSETEAIVVEAEQRLAATQQHAAEQAIGPERIEAAEQAVVDASEVFEGLRDELARLQNELVRQEEEERLAAEAAEAARRWEQEASATAQVDVSKVPTDAVEVYTLSRVAAQRLVGNVGTLPLVVEDAYVGLPVEAQQLMRNLLIRISGIVQVIYLSDDPDVIEWADGLSPDVGERQAVFEG